MELSTRRIWIIGGAVAIVLILAAGAYALYRGKNSPASVGTVATSTASSTTTTTSGALHVSGSSSYTVTQLPDKYVPAGPDHKTPLSFSSSVSPDVRAALNAQFSTIQKLLSANLLDFNAWIDLGMIRKIGGDYAGAVADWEYASKLYPTNMVSPANLADLYTNFSHDYPKAAAALKQEIKNNPTDVYEYMNLYQLYTGPYPQSSAVIEATLREGIAANPNATELKTALSQYQAAHP